MRFRTELLLLLMGGALVTALALGVGAFAILRNVVTESTERRLRDEAALLAVQAGEALPRGGSEALVRNASATLGLRITLIGRDGAVLADSGAPADAMDNHLQRPEVQEARLTGTGSARRTSDTDGREYFYFAQSAGAGGALGYVRIALPAAELERFQLRHLLWLCAAIVAGLGLIALMAWAIAGRLSRPVEHMSAVATRVSEGDLDQVVPEVRQEEIGRLGRSVNRMKDALLEKLEELREERELLVTMLEGMDAGVLLLGPERRVLMANAAFRKLFRVPVDPAGHLLGEVVRHPAVIEAVDSVLEGEDERRQTVSGLEPEGSFQLHVRSVAIPGGIGGRGALVLIVDITRLEALERVRRQFVADVSHELRTPLTSIKGAIDTLLDGLLPVVPDARRFLEVARRQANRMAELIADLTDLSLIETGAIRLHLEAVDLGEIAGEVAAAVRQKHPDAQVDIRSEVPGGHRVVADRRRLEQILVNLVDNGVKFNLPGGSVVIRASHEAGIDRISITDTGTGIPPDCLERVFHRFFRVDRARARNAGGTGLGLAIVKHLVHLHRGEVRVASTPGKGSCFTIDLPPATSDEAREPS